MMPHMVRCHMWLAQKVCTRSAHAAVGQVNADALLKKALNVCRKKAGEYLHYGRVEEAVLNVEMTDWS